MSTTTSLLTFEEFERLPDTRELGRCELLEGEVIHSPLATRQHMQSAQRLFLTLIPLVEPAGIGQVYIVMGYKLGGNTWQVPDVSIAWPNHPGDDYLEGAPLLAVEIVSEYTKAADLNRKVNIYLAHGSQEVWVLYPSMRFVWVFKKGRARDFEGVLSSPILPNLEIDLEAVFG